MSERLQKVLARHGLGSRREIERWIAEGRVTVNRVLAKVGAAYQPGDRVAIDGKEVTARLAIEVNAQVLIYHKSQGQPIERGSTRTRQPPSDELEADEAVVTHTVDDVATMAPALDELPAVRGSRWVAINPMHAGDSGLLLVTNDGNLGFALTRRKRWIPTAYMVRVLAPGSAQTPPEVPLSISYDDGRGQADVQFTKVESMGGEGANLWYRVDLERADRRAAVRALFESMELKVSRMTQVTFGQIELPRDLPRGRSRALTADQMAALYELARIKVPEPPQPKEFRRDPRGGRAVAPDRRRAAKPKFRAKSTDKESSDRGHTESDTGAEMPRGRHHQKYGVRRPLTETEGRRKSAPGKFASNTSSAKRTSGANSTRNPRSTDKPASNSRGARSSASKIKPPRDRRR